MKFNEFNFNQSLLDGLDAMGFEQATPIQEQAIPAVLNGDDLIACAQTGTGKTAAYLLPVINQIQQYGTGKLSALVIAPTRELAIQIDRQIEGLGYFTGVSSTAVYGGSDGQLFAAQQKAMREGADIVVATPGRLLAMLTSSGSVNMKHIKHLILDEADRMLDMGFYEDIRRVVNYLPKQRQTLLFSATMPPRIRQLANSILYQPKQINIAVSKPADGILQQAYNLYDEQKISVLQDILSQNKWGSIIIFAGTKEKVKELGRELKRIVTSLKAFHSDLEQIEREEIMQQFRNREIQILIGTDILSRGIDVDGIDLVVNFDVPPDPEDYIHRIGRTARAESTGTAITFINPKDQIKFLQIETLMDRVVEKLTPHTSVGQTPVYNPTQKIKPKQHGKSGFKKSKPTFKKQINIKPKPNAN